MAGITIDAQGNWSGLVIPRSRTITLGGERFTRDKFLVELQTQSLADVRAYVRAITTAAIEQQTALGNPPQIMTVDDSTNKSLAAVEKRTTTLFGVTLATTAMRAVEIELASAIAQSTTSHSGRLASITSTWQWLFIPKGGAPRVVSSGTPPTSFNVGDQLVLMPREVPYATITNRNVVHGGKLFKTSKKIRKSGRNQHHGFLAAATAAVRSKAAFKLFSVSAVFSRRHMVPGELMTRTSGTGMIVIRAHINRVKV